MDANDLKRHQRRIRKQPTTGDGRTPAFAPDSREWSGPPSAPYASPACPVPGCRGEPGKDGGRLCDGEAHAKS